MSVERADVAQSCEGGGVTDIRRSREQQDAPRPARERMRRTAPIACTGSRVRLIQDDEVPGGVFEGAEHFGPLGEVDRGQVDARQRPGVDVSRPIRRSPAKPGGVGILDLEREAIAQFLPPLRLQPRRDQEQRAEARFARRELQQNQARLDRLAETYRIGHQHAGDAVTDHCQQRLELMREQLHRRACRRDRPSIRCRRGHRAPKDVQEAACVDRSNAHRRAGRRRPIERSQDRERRAPRRGQPQLRGRRPRGEIPECPALAADAKLIADLPDGGSHGALGSRDASPWPCLRALRRNSRPPDSSRGIAAS